QRDPPVWCVSPRGLRAGPSRRSWCADLSRARDAVADHTDDGRTESRTTSNGAERQATRRGSYTCPQRSDPSAMNTPFDPQVMREKLGEAESALNTDQKGHAYERALRYAFETAGCMVEQNPTNFGGAEEIDLGVGNLGSFPLLPRIFLVECKDWDVPVDSK